MRNPAHIDPRVQDDDLDTDTGLPRKLGWSIAIWALGSLQLMIIALQGFLISATVDQGRRIARIEGQLHIQANSSEGMKYVFRMDDFATALLGNNHFIPEYKEVP